jgi:hypothetical protein
MDTPALRHPTLALAALAALAAAACGRRPPEAAEGLLVFTQIVVPQDGGEPDWRFPARARLAALDPSAPGPEPVILTPDFAAARAPDVHFDGRRLVFAGRREAQGPWQIWELDLGTRAARLLVPSCTRCTDPVYRADGGVVFVGPAGDAVERMAVYTVGASGGEPERITYHPGSDAAPGLVSDGRVIVATANPPGSREPNAYFAVRHDGTGAELLYRGGGAPTRVGRGPETRGRTLIFVERSPRAPDRVVSISQAYPDQSREELLAPPEGRIQAVAPAPDSAFIVSYRGEGPVFGLWAWPADGVTPQPLLEDPEFHATEPVFVERRPRPLGFVSAIDPSASTGTFYGMNARLTGLASVDEGAAVLRVRSADGDLGEVPLAPDGSFHVELPANTPLQLETRDVDGRIVRGPSAWIWVRPGELRGCVGCHESRALTPANRLPVAAGQPAVPLTEVAGSGPAAEEAGG